MSEERKAFRDADGSPRWSLTEIIVTASVGLVVAGIMSVSTTWVSSQVFRAGVDLRFTRVDERVRENFAADKDRSAKFRAELRESIRDFKQEIRDLRGELRSMPIRIRDLLKKE